MNKKKLERIKIVLDIIEKKIKSEPEKETFEIPLVEFIKMSKIDDRISLEQIFKEIKEKTNENLLINIYDPSYEYDDPVFRDDKVKINLPLAVSFHIEDADEFNKYKRLIERQIKTISNSFALILNNNGELYVEGNKENKNYPMAINALRYKIVHFLASRKEGKPRPKTHEFAFTGSIRCGVCNCLYTAETKRRLLKSGEIHEHTYYHCTRRTTKIKCDQRKNIPVEDLEVMIEKEIEKYTILPEFLHWALEGLNKKNDTEIEDRTKIYEMQHKNLVEAQKELDELTKMRYRQLIDDETFIKEKNELQAQIAKMKENLRQTETRAEKWLELTEKTFNFATYARAAFLKASEMGKAGLELKKEILLAIGKTPIIKREKLFIEPNEWLVPIENGYPALEKKI